ncbi:MAG: hypothetical protein V1858_04200 [Candidatus Gottesmanbacteria bacterium]
MFYFIFIFFGFIFLHLSYNILSIRPDGWYVGHVNLWGDLPLHLAFINSFLEQGKIFISSPIFSHSLPNYPILPDLLTAVLVKLNIPLAFALGMQFFILTMLLVFIIRKLILNFIKNEKVVFLTLMIFFFASGFGFYYFFQDYTNADKPLWLFLNNLPREYTNIKELGFWWINPIFAYFLPQRTTLFGFVLGLTTLWLWWKGYQTRKTILYIVAGLLTGLLPLVHPQSLIALFLLAVFFTPMSLVAAKQKKVIFFNWFIFGLITVFLALPLFFLTSSQAESVSKFLRVQVGWTAGQENIIWFWVKNLGLFWLFYILSLFWIFKRKRQQFYLHLPFLCLFIIANIIVFQPWDFDNGKIFLYWFISAAFLVASFLNHFFLNKGLLLKTILLVIIFLMTFSSLLDIWRSFTPVSNLQLFDSNDIAMANVLKIATPKSAVFLTYQYHNNPVNSLAGRSIFLGYDGWLWSHGINYWQKKDDLIKMFAGDIDLLKNYGINYIVIGPHERENLQINYIFLKQFSLIYNNQKYQVYQLK